MEKKLKIIGIISLVLGSIAALFCIIHIPFSVFYAILSGFLGTIGSTLYIFLDTRYEINTKKITPGIIALILSSIPILLVLAVVIKNQINH
ncbi:MAG: hypothetical protein H0W84_06030 [Bacteroidetes bacterium]|nr:hypothetical protein [Bacteroidota bacterium]